MTLLLEMLKSDELGNDELLIGGAWTGVEDCVSGRPSLGPTALELGIYELGVLHVNAIGRPADWVSVLRGKAGRAGRVLQCLGQVIKCFAGQAARPDVAACVSSGLFELSLEAVAAFAAAGVDRLVDTDPGAVYHALGCLRYCRAEPGSELKIRSVAPALAFCLEHNLDLAEQVGATTQANAAAVCCGVFGRDEGGSEFSFSQQHIDILLTRWSQIVRAVGWNKNSKPTDDLIMALELCISDERKPLLLANKDFISYLVDALLLDPDHPRAGMKEENKTWCQQHHTECLAQLAVFGPAREALLQDSSVIPALQAVADAGMSAEARELAGAALQALSDKEMVMMVEGQKHIMLSYQWDNQGTVQRINDSLISRSFVTWFDLTNMKGSTMDAMRYRRYSARFSPCLLQVACNHNI